MLKVDKPAKTKLSTLFIAICYFSYLICSHNVFNKNNKNKCHWQRSLSDTKLLPLKHSRQLLTGGLYILQYL